MKLLKYILFLALVLFQLTSNANSVIDANGQIYFRTIPKKSIVNLIDYTSAISGNNLKTGLNTLNEVVDDALLLDLYSSLKTLSPSQITRLNNAILKTDGTINNALSELIVKLSEGGTNALSRIAKSSFKDANGVHLLPRLAEDLVSNIGFKSLIVAHPSRLDAWEILITSGKLFAKTNPDILTTFSGLSNEIRPLILKFSDNSVSNSTIAKFIEDCDNSPLFKNFINNPQNESIVKGFVSHKSGVDLSNVTDELAELTTESVDLLLDIKVKYWYNRSTRIVTNNSKFAKARKFEDANSLLISQNTSGLPCSAWGGNANRIHVKHLQIKRVDGGTKRIVLDDALISPIAEYDQLGNKFHRVLYHDSKLTNAAPWTNNQSTEIIDFFTAPNNSTIEFIEFEVRNNSQFFIDNSIHTILTLGDKIRIYKVDIFKSISSGDGNQIINTIQIF